MIYTYVWWKEAGESISVHLNYISQTTDTSLQYTASSLIKNSFQQAYVTGPFH